MDPNTGGNPTLPPTVSSPHGYVLSGKLMLSGIVVLFAIAIFILFLHFYVRWYVIRRHDRRRRRRSLLVSASAAEDDNLPHSPAARGLDKGVLDSLSVEVFSDDDDGGAELEAECAVCINDFGEGEKVRVLPRCGHRFHVDCIDTWFCSHSTCPLCRCAVGAVTPPTPTAGDGAASELAVSVPDPRIGEVRIEIPEESGSTSAEAPVKLPGHLYISSIRRFFVGELRVESSDRATPPPPQPPATPQ